MHIYVPGSHGSRRVILHGVLSDGREEIHGTARAPKRFQSDQGTQLVAASKQLATWDWTAVYEQAEREGAEWHIVPTTARQRGSSDC